MPLVRVVLLVDVKVDESFVTKKLSTPTSRGGLILS